MRGLAKSGAEKAMEMKFRKTGLARHLLEQNTCLVFGGKEITSATEPTEGVVMEKLRHEGMILPAVVSARWCRRSAPARYGIPTDILGRIRKPKKSPIQNTEASPLARHWDLVRSWSSITSVP